MEFRYISPLANAHFRDESHWSGLYRLMNQPLAYGLENVFGSYNGFVMPETPILLFSHSISKYEYEVRVGFHVRKNSLTFLINS